MHALELGNQTTFGRYSFCRFVYGIKSAPEVFQTRSSAIFGNIRGALVIFDDIIIAAEEKNEHDDILLQVLLQARKSNIRFNVKKLQLKVTSIKYLGLIVSANGISPDKNMVKAVNKMPKPVDKAALQRFLGMFTYLSKFVDNFFDKTLPLKQLFKQIFSELRLRQFRFVCWSQTRRHDHASVTLLCRRESVSL